MNLLNKIVTFFLELAMLASFACFGFQKGGTPLVKYGLAVLLPILAIVLWGYFAAPKSSHRLELPAVALFRGLIFLAAALCLFLCHQRVPALTMAVLAILTQIASFFGEDKT